MDVALWKQKITPHSAPPWPCPHCKRGTLVLVKDSLTPAETVASATAHDDPNWDPDWVAYTFSCWLKCANTACGQRVAVIGTGGLEPRFDPEVRQESWEPLYSPSYAIPMPQVFEIPDDCPLDVQTALDDSFRLIWSDPSAAASRLRVALEVMLSKIGVPERQRKPGKIVTLTLHRRIEILGATAESVATNLMAVKWLGNTGSHDTAVTLDDLFTAYEIVKHAIDELIAKRTKSVAALARNLKKKHLPRVRKMKK